MKVSLISPFESVVSYGVRCLSAVLKQAGFETQMIFLPRESEGLPWEGFRYAYPPRVLDEIAQLAVRARQRHTIGFAGDQLALHRIAPPVVGRNAHPLADPCREFRGTVRRGTERTW